jgi:hypothetical protein
MTTIYVHAWEYVNGTSGGGGGYSWFRTPAPADLSYLQCEPTNPEFASFRFDYETPAIETDDIEAELEELIDDLSAKATRRRVGAAVRAYWSANNIQMGAAD